MDARQSARQAAGGAGRKRPRAPLKRRLPGDCRRVTDTDSTVLILGEPLFSPAGVVNGAGNKLLARPGLRGWDAASNLFPRRTSLVWKPIPGRATFANCKTSSSGPSSRRKMGGSIWTGPAGEESVRVCESSATRRWCHPFGQGTAKPRTREPAESPGKMPVESGRGERSRAAPRSGALHPGLPLESPGYQTPPVDPSTRLHS